MSIQSELDRISGNIASAYSAVQEKGGALPEERNSGNLAAAVRGIPSNGSAAPAGSNVPSGGIIMWSGPADTIPDGWALCDGTNGTPDLVNRFVLGAGANKSIFALSSQNQGMSNSMSAVTLTPKRDIPAITVFYEVSSEARYDKFSILRGTDSIVADQSGVVSDSVTVSDLTPSDVLKFTYKKDSSGDKNDDTATFWINLPDGENLSAQLLEELFEIGYPEAHQFIGGDLSVGAAKGPGETGGSETAPNLVAKHTHSIDVPITVDGSLGTYSFTAVSENEGIAYSNDTATFSGLQVIPAGTKSRRVEANYISSGNSTDSGTIPIMPPYYALCYIMKL